MWGYTNAACLKHDIQHTHTHSNQRETHPLWCTDEQQKHLLQTSQDQTQGEDVCHQGVTGSSLGKSSIRKWDGWAFNWFLSPSRILRPWSLAAGLARQSTTASSLPWHLGAATLGASRSSRFITLPGQKLMVPDTEHVYWIFSHSLMMDCKENEVVSEQLVSSVLS